MKPSKAAIGNAVSIQANGGTMAEALAGAYAIDQQKLVDVALKVVKLLQSNMLGDPISPERREVFAAAAEELRAAAMGGG